MNTAFWGVENQRGGPTREAASGATDTVRDKKHDVSIPAGPK